MNTSEYAIPFNRPSRLGNEFLEPLGDAAVLPAPGGRVCLTTDSFVVTPLFFPGSDIGHLAVCGTVNDLAMAGAEPVALTCGLILEEGLSLETLDAVLDSLAACANDAGVGGNQYVLAPPAKGEVVQRAPDPGDEIPKGFRPGGSVVDRIVVKSAILLGEFTGHLLTAHTGPAAESHLLEPVFHLQGEIEPPAQGSGKGQATLHGRTDDAGPGGRLPHLGPHLPPAQVAQGIVDPVTPVTTPPDRFTVAQDIDGGQRHGG